jgi:hypothetical protein
MKHNLTCDDSHIPGACNVQHLSCVITCTTHKPYQKRIMFKVTWYLKASFTINISAKRLSPTCNRV